MEFKSLNIIKPIIDALDKEGYKNPTPIQERTIPLLLENKDVIGIAQTGTGKTAAFAIPILQKLNSKSESRKSLPRALVLAPTRELAAQISDSFKTYGKYLKLKHTAVFGGVGIEPQIKAIRKGVDIIIATPGRLLDLMNQRKVNLTGIKFLVLDEADRMLDMGFLKDVNKIISALPKEKQSLFFSATMSKDIAELTRKFLRNPERVDISPESATVEKIEQKVFFINREDKNELLLDLIKQEKINCALVFVNAKHKANKIATILNDNGISANAIHGNKSQAQRIVALNEFKSGKIQVLVATDIAARGIDVNNISHVINYDLPNEPENYVHRIGRTARAGNDGIAYSFCVAEDRNYLNEIEKLTRSTTEESHHKYHSEIAKKAKGAQARPKPRSQGRGARSNSGSNSRGNSGSNSRERFGGRQSSGNGGKPLRGLFGGNRKRSGGRQNRGNRNNNSGGNRRVKHRRS